MKPPIELPAATTGRRTTCSTKSARKSRHSAWRMGGGREGGVVCPCAGVASVCWEERGAVLGKPLAIIHRAAAQWSNSAACAARHPLQSRHAPAALAPAQHAAHLPIWKHRLLCAAVAGQGGSVHVVACRCQRRHVVAIVLCGWGVEERRRWSWGVGEASGQRAAPPLPASVRQASPSSPQARPAPPHTHQRRRQSRGTARWRGGLGLRPRRPPPRRQGNQ